MSNTDEVGVIPKSIGALLAEEWTSDPFSPMQSFLEMIWIQEADTSIHQGIASSLESLSDILEKEIRSIPDFDDAEEDQNEASRWRTYLHHIQSFLERSKRKGLVIARNILARYRLEIVSLILYLVERESLIRTNSTIAESMYGGRRVKITDAKNNSHSKARSLSPLEGHEKTRLALCKALVPYIRVKLDKALWVNQSRRKFLMHQVQRDLGSTKSDLLEAWKTQQWAKIVILLRQRVPRVFKQLIMFLYPYLRASVQGINLLCHWRFLMGQSFSFDLISELLKQAVRRVTVQDSVKSDGTEIDDASPQKSSNNSDTGSGLSLNLQQYLVKGVGLAIAASWITWIRSEYDRAWREEQIIKSASCGTSGIVPAPPVSKERLDARDECPVCHAAPRRHPATSVVSCGHVFCFECIQNYVQRHDRCPMTKRPCSEDQLVRLYEPRFQTSAAQDGN